MDILAFGAAAAAAANIARRQQQQQQQQLNYQRKSAGPAGTYGNMRFMIVVATLELWNSPAIDVAAINCSAGALPTLDSFLLHSLQKNVKCSGWLPKRSQPTRVQFL